MVVSDISLQPLLGLTMQGVAAAAWAVFFEFKAIRVITPIFFGCIGPLPAFSTCQRDHCAHRFLCHFSFKRGRRIRRSYLSPPVSFLLLNWSERFEWLDRRQANQSGQSIIYTTNGCYSMILLMTPAPTVRPPSRMAKRLPASSATGTINLTCKLTRSPGMTISTPSGSCTAPVTSMVRM